MDTLNGKRNRGISINSEDRKNIFKEVEAKLVAQGLTFDEVDTERPWGGFFLIKESQIKLFANIYFPACNSYKLIKIKKVSPKILVVLPHKRLSWQYHFRRAELWKVISNKVGIIKSKTNEEAKMQLHSKGDVLFIEVEERHRLIGLDEVGIVAEIWQHTDENNPSDEEDIIRLQDDYLRK